MIDKEVESLKELFKELYYSKGIDIDIYVDDFNFEFYIDLKQVNNLNNLKSILDITKKVKKEMLPSHKSEIDFWFPELVIYFDKSI